MNCSEAELRTCDSIEMHSSDRTEKLHFHRAGMMRCDRVAVCAGQPLEETQFSYVPASAALQVYGCGVLITIGAALCFSSRQRRHLHTTCVDGNAAQFIIQSDKLTPGSSMFGKPEHSNLLQPLLPEASV